MPVTDPANPPLLCDFDVEEADALSAEQLYFKYVICTVTYQVSGSWDGSAIETVAQLYQREYICSDTCVGCTGQILRNQ